ncbi:hypothetical protein [Rhizobium sp. SL86]|uniref:hypothetical protein n=1 Tax=Rhizobium sp. SL86 TaxID=2995148 RepID=UPI002272903E|nr:hypothetical protein [Rhizobium sp. SL86]MCY1666599.1 hypothetical protein [Rhizobium sp. SL86]
MQLPGSSFSSLIPMISEVMFVGAGRNANNLMGIFEAAGAAISHVVDDQPQGRLLGKAVETIDSVAGAEADAFLTITDPDIARRIRERPALANCRWPRFVFPNCVVSGYSSLSEGCYIGPFSLVTNAIIGRHVHLFAYNCIGARAEIGEFSAILPHAMISSDVRIGKGCVIATGAVIFAGVTIGDNCKVGPNLVIRHDMKSGTIALPTTPIIRSRSVLRGRK